ncbi:MAG TPA: aminotransferase class IV [Polyangia bacterium]
MATRVYNDGRVVLPEEATVPVFDRGFLYGDSVYEVLRTFGGHPFALTEHLARLAASAAGLGLTLPARAAVAGAITETLAAAGNPESYVRIVVTRGSGPIGLDPALGDRPRLVVIVTELALPDDLLYRDGAEVAIVNVQRNHPRALDPAVKSGNYLNSVLALAEARRRGAYEAVLRDGEGRLTEGASSSIFVVTRGVVRTPPLRVGILDGITRRQTLALAQAAGIETREAMLEPADLRGAEEAFLTSTVRGILPVVRVDGAAIGDGRPGPVTLALRRGYLELAARTAVGA